jgi:hypothetical protein
VLILRNYLRARTKCRTFVLDLELKLWDSKRRQGKSQS